MYLENYNPSVKNKAKKLNIYYNKFKTDIKVTDILKEGFTGAKIGQELKEREKKYIYNFLLSKN